MLTICCLKVGPAYGPEYVNILYDMVLRNLAEGFPGRFVCFTDNPQGLDVGIQTREPLPGVWGWWNKMYLYKKGVFEDGERVLYLDLDTLITGRLDEIASFSGDFAVLEDFFKGNGAFQASIVAWEAGKLHHVWQTWADEGHPIYGFNDQTWLEEHVQSGSSPVEVTFWQKAFSELFVSYKMSEGQIPSRASVVVFHGEPRPHQVPDGWVPRVWKVGGITRAELDVICNTEQEVYMANVRANCERDLPWFDTGPDTELQVAIVGGAPSVKDAVSELKRRWLEGQHIWALNGAFQWLVEHEIQPHAHFIIDAREANRVFLQPTAGVKYCLASQCHPSLFELLAGHDVVVLHMATSGMQEFLEVFPTLKPTHLLGGGTTVAMKAMLAADLWGYKGIHLYGVDSSYTGDAHHAYEQSLNAGERIMNVLCGEQMFRCAPWMVTQANDFQVLANYVTQRGRVVTVNGEGLLPSLARQMMTL